MFAAAVEGTEMRITYSNYFYILIGVLVAAIIFVVVYYIWIAKKNKAIRKRIYENAFVPYAEFEKDWIAARRRGRKGMSGYKYEDGPGCYVILIFDHPVEDGNWTGYDDIYIGQSVNVCQRVHNHFNGKGNGDVYADVRNGKYAYVQFRRCEKSEMNNLEKSLIRAFGATDSYNKTRGGATKR